LKSEAEYLYTKIKNNFSAIISPYVNEKTINVYIYIWIINCEDERGFDREPEESI